MNEYLTYPHRRRGMDHDFYDWSIINDRPPVEWPGGARVAFWPAITLEFFRFDQPETPVVGHGAPTAPYPNYREYTHRDYGLRVGVFRLLEVLKRYEIPATIVINSEVCVRYPALVEKLNEARCEFVVHGRTSSLPLHPGMSEDEEESEIATAIENVRAASALPVRGWLSPSIAPTMRTAEIAARHGIDYILDWPNDDLPYPFRAGDREIYALPIAWELNDFNSIWSLRRTSEDFARHVVEANRFLDEEAARLKAGRALCVALRPWISGHPHRIGDMDRMFARIRESDGLWPARAGEIVDAFASQGAG